MTLVVRRSRSIRRFEPYCNNKWANKDSNWRDWSNLLPDLFKHKVLSFLLGPKESRNGTQNDLIAVITVNSTWRKYTMEHTVDWPLFIPLDRIIKNLHSFVTHNNHKNFLKYSNCMSVNLWTRNLRFYPLTITTLPIDQFCSFMDIINKLLVPNQQNLHVKGLLINLYKFMMEYSHFYITINEMSAIAHRILTYSLKVANLLLWKAVNTDMTPSGWEQSTINDSICAYQYNLIIRRPYTTVNPYLLYNHRLISNKTLENHPDYSEWKEWFESI
jgi:hypothetical protein